MQRSQVSYKNMQDLLTSLSKSKLRTLMLTEMALEDDSIQNAAELLARNKNLHRLYLQNN